jgi:hypothetical protein
MMNIAELHPGEMILKYKSVFALKRESEEIQSWFDAEWKQAARLNDVYKALFSGDDNVLSKAASADLQLAKSHVADMKKRHRPDIVDASLASADRMAAIMREYKTRVEANREEAQRSRRLNEAWTSASLPTLH